MKAPNFAIKYQRLAKCRGRKKAIIVIARMMLSIIYHILSNNENFHSDDYKTIVNPSKQKTAIVILDNALQFLRDHEADPEALKLVQPQCAAQAG